MSGAERSYLDWNATAPMRDAARQAVLAAMSLPGNPSSVHAEGRAARAVVERAREQVALLVGGEARRVVFTSGGTEANAATLTPSLHLAGGPPAARLLISATEHPCVREGHRFPRDAVTILPVGADGVIDLGVAEKLIAATARSCLVSVHLANNETGVIQPIGQLGLVCRQHNALLHVDAVQAAGKIAIDMSTLGADVLTLSGHKIGGPKGVGAVVFGSDNVVVGERLLVGGGQEKGARAGTENVAGIAGFGAAAAEALGEIAGEGVRQTDLRDSFERELQDRIPDAVIFGAAALRLPNTSCFAAPGRKAETLLILMDLAGVSVSSGSACSSGKVKASHVLAAMGVAPDLGEGALRVSIGRTTTAADVARLLEACSRTLGDRRAAAA
jgi:cysteine desulfurase